MLDENELFWMDNDNSYRKIDDNSALHLKDQKIVDELFHLNGHFSIVSKLQPKTIEQLAAVLAIIRPAKRYLVNAPWDDILKEVWIRPADGSYFFKKSHAVAYAQAIVVQMNLIARDKYSFSATQET